MPSSGRQTRTKRPDEASHSMESKRTETPHGLQLRQSGFDSVSLDALLENAERLYRLPSSAFLNVKRLNIERLLFKSRLLRPTSIEDYGCLCRGKGADLTFIPVLHIRQNASFSHKRTNDSSSYSSHLWRSCFLDPAGREKGTRRGYDCLFSF